MTGQRTITYAAAAAPFLVMGAILGFLMLFGAGGESAARTGRVRWRAVGRRPATTDRVLPQRRSQIQARHRRLRVPGGDQSRSKRRSAPTWPSRRPGRSAGCSSSPQRGPSTRRRSLTRPPRRIRTTRRTRSTPRHALLSANGAPRDWPQAIFDYNHSQAYVEEVQADAQRYSGANGITNLQDDIAAAWGNSQQPTWDTPVQPASHSTVEVSQVGSAVESGSCGAVEVDDVTPVNGSAGVIMPNGLARPGSTGPGQCAGDGRCRRPDHQSRVQLWRRALRRSDESNAPGSRRVSRRTGERRTRVRLQLGDVICPVGWRLRRA